MGNTMRGYLFRPQGAAKWSK